MIQSIRNAWQGGWRAGKMPPIVVNTLYGKHTLSFAMNPYDRWQGLRWMAWECGYWEGVMKRLDKYERR